MTSQNRINEGVFVVSMLVPNWNSALSRFDLHHVDNISTCDDRHMLAKLFGSFEEGKRQITEYSGRTLEQLGLMPLSRAEALTLLRGWHGKVVNPLLKKAAA